MSNIPFIKHDEHVFIIYENGEHEGRAGIISSVDNVVEMISRTEGVVRIIRFDQETMKGVDISEEIADAYIKKYGIVNDHPFIDLSQSYQDEIDCIEQEERNDRVYGTYEQQNRLSPSQLI